MAFLYAGIVSLIGWNGLLTASGYLDREIFTGKNWAFLCAITYAFGITLGQALLIRGPLPKLPFSIRWQGSVITNTLAPLGVMIIVNLAGKSVDNGDLYFALCLVCVILLSLGNSMFQGCIFGLAGAADPMLSGRIMAGQGIAGIITGIDSFLPPGRVNFTVLLLVCVVITAVALLVYCGLMQNSSIVLLLEHMASSRNLAATQRLAEETPMTPATARRKTRRIIRDVAPQAFGVFFVFLVTFTVFPGVVVRWKGAFGIQDTSFVTLMIGLFQLMDVVGRMLGGWVRKPNGRATLAASALRVVFVPLFILAQRAADGSFWSSGPWKVAIMAAFAFSNGLVATLGMMLGPERVEAKSEKEQAGNIMSLSLVSGILAGSLLALLTQR